MCALKSSPHPQPLTPGMIAPPGYLAGALVEGGVVEVSSAFWQPTSATHATNNINENSFIFSLLVVTIFHRTARQSGYAGRNLL